MLYRRNFNACKSVNGQNKCYAGNKPSATLVVTYSEAAGRWHILAKWPQRCELGGASMDSLWQDFKYGLRQLRKNLGVTAIMVFTLALAIGATTAIFSVVYGVLLRPLPYADSNRIMAVFEVSSAGRPNRIADPNFDDFRDQNRSFQAIAKYNDDVASVSGVRSLRARRFRVCHPIFSRSSESSPSWDGISASSDAKKGAGPTVLVSYGYWREHLGSPQDLSQSHLEN